MSVNTLQRKAQKNVLDLTSAAFEAGYSTRHFRKIIEEDQIPLLQIGRKFFILARDLEAWKETKAKQDSITCSSNLMDGSKRALKFRRSRPMILMILTKRL